MAGMVTCTLITGWGGCSSPRSFANSSTIRVSSRIATIAVLRSLLFSALAAMRRAAASRSEILASRSLPRAASAASLAFSMDAGR